MANKTNAPSTNLTRTESYQYPNAHFNHLTADQNIKLAEFKTLAQEAGYYHLASSSRSRPSHDDETLLRYLRARKFVPADAYKQFKDTEDWRRNNEIDKLYDTIDIAEYDETRRLVCVAYGAICFCANDCIICSIRNGPGDEINVGFRFMFSKLLA